MASDDVVICDGNTAQITNNAAVARTVTGGQVEIIPSSALASLTLGTTSSSELQTDSSITLKVGSGHVSRLKFVAANHAFAGSRIITGESDLAEIVIGANITLRNAANIEGFLKIVKAEGVTSGKFVNDAAGTVAATSAGHTLVVAPYELDGDGLWSAAGGGTLEFSAEISMANELGGPFLFPDQSNASTIIVNKELTSTGTLTSVISAVHTLVVNENLTLGTNSSHCDFDGGTIVVAAGAKFIHH